MTDIASFGVAVDTRQIKDASVSLDQLAQSSGNAEAATQKLTNASQTLAQAQAKFQTDWFANKNTIQQTNNVTFQASIEVQRLLDKYDPLGTKLRSLEADFNMLNKAASQGLTGSKNDAAVDKTYAALNAEMVKTRALMVDAGVATGEAGEKMAGLGLNTQYARRELMTLGREAMTGDFSRMPLTFGSLVAHSNLLSVLLNPVALGVAAITAAVGAGVFAWEKWGNTAENNIKKAEGALKDLQEAERMEKGSRPSGHTEKIKEIQEEIRLAEERNKVLQGGINATPARVYGYFGEKIRGEGVMPVKERYEQMEIDSNNRRIENLKRHQQEEQELIDKDEERKIQKLIQENKRAEKEAKRLRDLASAPYEKAMSEAARYEESIKRASDTEGFTVSQKIMYDAARIASTLKLAGATDEFVSAYLNQIATMAGDEERAKAVTKANEDHIRQYNELIKSADDLNRTELDCIEKKLAAQQLHNAEIGKTAAQRDLEKQKVMELDIVQKTMYAQAMHDAADQLSALGEEYSAYAAYYSLRANGADQALEAQKKLNAAMGDAAAIEAAAAAAKKSAEEWKKFTDEIERSLTDALMRGFESGKSFGQNFVDSLKHILETAALKIAVQAVVDPVMGGVKSVAAGGDFMSAMGSANNMFSAGSSLFSSGAGITSMAELSGSAPIMAADVATNVAAGGSGLAAGGVMSSLSAAAPYVAAAYMAYSLLSGSKEGPASGTGYRASGAIGAGGTATGTGYSLASNGSSNFADLWPTGNLQQNANLGGVRQQYQLLQDQAAQIATGLGATAASVSGMSIPFSISTGMVGAAGIGAAITQSMVDNFPQATIKALQSSAMPDYLGKFFDALTPGSMSTTDANSALQFAQQMKQVHDSLLETRSPLEVMRAQMDNMAKALGTSADAYKHDFAAAIENGIKPSVFTQWQQLGTAIDNVAKATTPLTANLSNMTDYFASKVEYDRLIGRIGGGSATAPVSNADLVDELRAMRAELAALRNSSESTAASSKQTSTLLRYVTRDGNSLLTTPA